MDIALGVEGEGGGGVTAVSVPAGRTLAGVAVLSIVGQHGDAACFVLTLVLSAADQKDVTVSPTPGLQARLWHRAVTAIGVGSVFARGTMLAGIAVTLVNVHLTMNACKERYTHLVLKFTLPTLIQLLLGRTHPS